VDLANIRKTQLGRIELIQTSRCIVLGIAANWNRKINLFRLPLYAIYGLVNYCPINLQL